MKGIINLAKYAVHYHFNDQQGYKRISGQTSSTRLLRVFTRAVWPFGRIYSHTVYTSTHDTALSNGLRGSVGRASH